MPAERTDPKLYIDGQWIGGNGRDTIPVIDPATGEAIGDLPVATAADLDRALQSAASAWPTWSATPAVERGRLLRRAAENFRSRRESIARMLTQEEGKPLSEALVEVDGAAGHIEWMAEEGRRGYGRVVAGPAGIRQTVLKRPFGVAAAFAPWNFPATTPARKLSASLAAGCCCILKAPEETPLTAMEMVRSFVEAGVPRGVINLVWGVPADISTHLIASPVVRKVSFTGSTAVGRQLAALAAAAVKPITMELGGHAPVLVFDDVDVEQVVRLCIASKYRNAGQVCVSPTRFYVHERIYDRFVSAFAQAVSGLKLGNGLDDGTQMGPLANTRRLAAVENTVADLRYAGARLVVGGERLDRAGNFFSPTVFADVPPTARAMREEPFGPIALLLPFRDEEAVIEQANALPYGLAAYAFTRDAGRQLRLSEKLDTGMLGLNTFFINGPETPWGGVKESGYGSEGATEGLEAYQTTRLVVQTSQF
ncbi:Alpha-ketoglutaric semialdehyde dehydrogenase [Pigmentiphaga humi]|uniref:Alpha-ketoglutaric semialdehyde dehydrogenase n=1 Tax=Pigmentiphaga humi TaxID=2478468 RepID=A0A3P4AXW4_9BURK|nr:NAD-dependent succinate-semialdehyde dehydrogenase [Pigmentiphaga humi]VCU68924.1 Alpha-ketoglutaric semialdehyde dehydrogenase [Pigmentiphaga humi]